MRDNASHYRDLFLHAVPMMDVRAPVEFNKGAFPGAVNLPLMLDHEREKVGVCYKQHGQDAAFALGNRLVDGQKKVDRIAAWAEFIHAHPEGYLYCFRGGLRSKVTQEWLKAETGILYPYVEGGYKAMRNFLLENIRETICACDFTVLGGLTGSGKTDVLLQLDHGLDLEGDAHHRGSSFGRHVSGQPTQINFENRLSIAMLQKRVAGHRLLVLEDEGRIIGSCALPLELYQGMQHFPMVWLDDDRHDRVQRILRDYVVNLLAEFNAAYDGETGFQLFADRLRCSLSNIAKRLGADRYRRLAALMEDALQTQECKGTVESHCAWITGLLDEYYDPMYVYQREQKASRIVFSGNQQAVLDYLRR